MKILLQSTFLSTLFLCLYACTQSPEDLVFAASDDLHLIKLYKNKKTFSMVYNGMNTIEGSFEANADTLFLTYADVLLGDQKANALLSRKLVIAPSRKTIHSADSGNRQPFCASIYLDQLNNFKKTP